MIVVFSLNIPIPGEVKRQAAGLAPTLVSFQRRRDQYTLVCKRFPDTTPADLPQLSTRLREELRGQRPFTVRVTGLDMFTDPPAGTGPVLYFVVESPVLIALHARLCDTFGAIPGIEGADYVPHITIARGGDSVSVEHVLSRSLRPIEWTVTEVWIWDAAYNERAGTISIPT